MGRTIYAEEHLRAYLTSLAKPDGYVIGLILGQVRLFFSSFFIFQFSSCRASSLVFNICGEDSEKHAVQIISSYTR